MKFSKCSGSLRLVANVGSYRKAARAERCAPKTTAVVPGCWITNPVLKTALATARFCAYPNERGVRDSLRQLITGGTVYSISVSCFIVYFLLISISDCLQIILFYTLLLTGFHGLVYRHLLQTQPLSGPSRMIVNSASSNNSLFVFSGLGWLI
jgi:hypothetical protein